MTTFVSEPRVCTCNECHTDWESAIEFALTDVYHGLDLFKPVEDCPNCGPRSPLSWNVAQVGIEQWHWKPAGVDDGVDSR